MNCYSCEGWRLRPIRLEHGLPARGCHRCGGVHIDLLAYRSWLESMPELPEDTGGDAPVEASDNAKALVCQRCSRVMVKYRVSSDTDNFIDLCAACDDVWLDEGEWRLLRSLHLAGHLTQIMTEPWQRHVRAETAARVRASAFESTLGAEGVMRLDEFLDWRVDHSARDEALKYMRQRLSI